MTTVKYVVAGVLVISVLAGLSYGAFLLKRSWNYSWYYENAVRSTVCEMVKPEHLVKPCK